MFSPREWLRAERKRQWRQRNGDSWGIFFLTMTLTANLHSKSAGHSRKLKDFSVGFFCILKWKIPITKLFNFDSWNEFPEDVWVRWWIRSCQHGLGKEKSEYEKKIHRKIGWSFGSPKGTEKRDKKCIEQEEEKNQGEASNKTSDVLFISSANWASKRRLFNKTIPQITQEKYVDKRDCTCNVNTESKEAWLKYCNSSAPELKKAKWIKGFKSYKCQSDLQPQRNQKYVDGQTGIINPWLGEKSQK